MPDPFRSPKQTRMAAKSRGHPYARPSNAHRTRDVGVERPSSLLGALKNIVTAPLTWFSAGDHPQGSDDTPQKRRVSVAERAGTPPRPKRVRRESPQDGEEVGYLDPPSSLFVSKRPPIPHWDISNGITPARTMSLEPPSSAVDPTGLPLPPSRGTSVMTRTSMSIEPHDTILKPRSMTRDSSMPPPSPFARSFSRSSFTPLAAGATFGPSPKRKTRESTAPPLLGPSPTPSFTRPPPAAAGHQTLFPGAPSRGRSEDSILAFLGKSRQSVSPMRESPSRSMLVGDESLVSRSPSIPKAERTLSTLESFRTPLQGPVFPSAPEARRPPKVHVPNPSKLRFDHTPEGKKDKGKRVPEVVGPYSSGMSGMRKLLARRRDELQKEAEMKNEGKVLAQGGPQAPHAEGDVNGARKDQSIETDADDNSEPHQSGVHVNGISSKEAAALPSSPPRSKADSYSSLRAPSNRVHRSHASAPKLKKPKNKFSLDDDEEEEEWGMSVEELKNYQALTQTRISFSSSRSMSEAGMQTDTSADDAARNRAVSPILPAQPQSFDSLLSRIGSSIGTTSKPVAEFPVEPPKAETDPKAQGRSIPTSESSTAPATLPFSLTMSSVPTSAPKPAEGIPSPFAAPSPTSAAVPSPALPSPVTRDGAIPSFFSNTQMQFTPPKVPSGSFFGAPLPNGDGEMGTERPSSLSGAEPASGKEEKKEQQQPSESKPSPFGDTSKLSAFGGSSASALGTSTLPSTASATSSTNVSSPFSKPLDGPEAPKSAFSFGTPSTNGAQAPISIFGAASKAASSQVPTTSDASTKPPFSFGSSATSTSTPSVDKPKETTSTAPSTDQSSKPLFSFGAPTSETPKSVFGFGTASEGSDKDAAPSPFSFGAAPSTPPPAEKKPGFTFGVTNAFTSSAGATAGDGTSTTPAAPKSVFGGFGSVGTPAAPSTPKPSQAMVENGDGMEVAADQMEESPTRTVEKKDTAAIQPPQTPAFAGFGTSTGSGGGFSFGQSKATPAESTYSLGQSKPSLSSGFSFGQSTNTSTTSANASTGFSFGTNSTKATGPPSSVFGAPLTSAFGGGSSNPAPSSFSFANPSTSSNANPFGQSQQQQENRPATAPSSPSLFPQATQSPSPSFSFSLPAPAGAFGAPKPDAATAPSTPSAQPFQFGTSSSSQQSQPQAGATAANNMFTLGGAATPPPRKVKGLPTRRGKRP
ncbi:hypothetical protein JB92DRAFT_2198359 [Gautieria morchelliformis]|nr:hypothetical protein JB92DRAFT_2198359 [Gautieria morchelliformis]